MPDREPVAGKHRYTQPLFEVRHGGMKDFSQFTPEQIAGFMAAQFHRGGQQEQVSEDGSKLSEAENAAIIEEMKRTSPSVDAAIASRKLLQEQGMMIVTEDGDIAFNYTEPEDDPAVQRITALKSIEGSTFSFLKEFDEGNDPVLGVLYGPAKSRLPKLQGVYGTKEVFSQERGPHLGIEYGTLGSDAEKKPNEDALFFYPLGENRFVAGVLDGASSQRPIAELEEQGISGAFYISHLAALEFPHSEEYARLTQNPQTTATDVMVTMNAWLHKRLQTVRGVDYKKVLTIPGAAATLAVVDYNLKKISVAHVADTALVIEKQSGEKQLVTDNKNKLFDDETMALVNKIAQEKNITRREAVPDPRIKEQLAASFIEKINTASGCGILNGMPELVTNNLIQTLEFPMGEGEDAVKRLYLVSDGFYLPWLTEADGQERLDVESMARAVRDGLVKSPTYDVKETLDDDPNFDAIPRLKHRDDETFLVLTI